jgi:LysR family transcriptional activator of glutamate synthase operon
MSIYKEGNRDAIYDFYYKRNRIQQIRGFITVVQEGTFASASDVLRVSRSTVFSQVKSLESKLGIVLFQKDGRNVSLTEEGKIFYDKSLPILSSIDNLYEDFVDNDINGYTKVLKIASHYIFLTKILPPSLVGVFEKDLKIKIALDSSIKYEAFKKLEDGQIDIAFFPCDKKDIREYKSLYFEKLTEYRMCGAFGHKFNFTQHMINNLYDYFSEFRTLLPKNHVVSKRAMENIDKLHNTAVVTVDTENMEVLKELAKQNVGTLFCDDRLFSEEDKKDLKILYLPRDETFNLHYYAITRKGTQMKDGIKALLDNVRNSIV